MVCWESLLLRNLVVVSEENVRPFSSQHWTLQACNVYLGEKLDVRKRGGEIGWLSETSLLSSVHFGQRDVPSIPPINPCKELSCQLFLIFPLLV